MRRKIRESGGRNQGRKIVKKRRKQEFVQRRVWE